MNQYKKLKSFLGLAWRLCPSYIILLLVDAFLNAGKIMANVILPKFLIDELLGVKEPNKLLFYGGLIVLSNLLFAFIDNLMKKTMTIKKTDMQEKMSHAMAEKIMNVEFSYLENPYYLDLKERAVFAVNNQSALENMVSSLAKAIKNIVTILSLVTILFTLSWGLVLFLILTIGLSIWIYSYFMDYQRNFFQSLIPINRKYGYYLGLSFQGEFHKDIRLYDMSPMLTQRVTEYNKEIMDEFLPFKRRQGVVLGLYGVINNLQAAVAYGYVGLRVISKSFGPPISIGSFTMYVSAAINFSKTTTELGENITTIFQMLGYLDSFMEFISLPEAKDDGGTLVMEEEIQNITFKNVSFKYPGAEVYVLKDISFEINGGEKISIVGLNGAGKTTLIKLLSRLYPPTSGEILVNGHNIYDYEHKSYMGEIAAIFQDYKLLAFTIGENITCQEDYKNDHRVMELIEEVGLKEKIDSLPEGINSILGKFYDDKGVELSGGQRQKIAIARALYKDAPLVILDEPTSALDPLAEAEIYEHFNTLVGGKTAIYISHRMSSSVFCDRILLIEDGKVADYDSHKNLMEKKDSLYYKLFNSQAVNYQLDS